MIGNVWLFKVVKGQAKEFIDFNIKRWQNFFKKSVYYQGTEIHEKVTEIGEFLIIDYWTSKGDFENFIKENNDEYLKLDAEHSKFCKSEKHIGFFKLQPFGELSR